MRAIRRACALAATILPCAAGAVQFDCSFQVHWENDLFVRGDSTDQWYTNGTRFSRSCPSAEPALDASVREFLLGRWSSHGALYVDPYATLFGQHMYTPRKIGIADPQPEDRPWAGWLYLGRTYQGVLTEDRFGRDVAVHRLAEWSIGIVGPSARAEQTQTWVHEQRPNATMPLGWRHQLRDEPVVNLRWLETMKFGDTSRDLLVRWGFNAGNVQTFANVGAAVRWGWNLNDFGVTTLVPAINDKMQPAATRQSVQAVETTFYVSAGVDARLVGHNIFLDGNTFKDSPSVDKKRIVVDGILSTTLRHKAWAFSYLMVWRSPEFKGQYGEPQRFGAVVVSVPFP